MAFLNPILLYGLMGATVPLLLHLLNRSRYRTVDWGAMLFLDAMEPRSHHSATLKQWGLLALRTGMIALIAVGLARPVLFARGIKPPRPGGSAAVMILDRSSSMSLNDNGRLRLDLAKEAVYQLLSPAFKRGDDLWLLPMGDGDPSRAASYATDPQELAQHVHDIGSASGVADAAAALMQARKLLDTSEASNREIYLICDRQAESWKHVDESFVQRWRREQEEAGRRRINLVVVPVGSEEVDNAAIESIATSPLPAVVDQPLDVQISVRNFGSVPRAGVPLTLGWRDAFGKEQILTRSTVNLPALGVVLRRITVKLPQAGSMILSASISATGLTTDKRLDYSLVVLDPIKVLIIDGDEGDEASPSASDFLRLALTPFHESRRNVFAVDVTRPDLWGPADLPSHSVVILTNVPSFTDAQARALQQFVYDGGGVIAIPGDQSRVENYNAQLPWLAASLQSVTPAGESGVVSLQRLNTNHPVLRFGAGYAEIGSALAVRRYFPSSPRGGAMVLAEYSDGNPFLASNSVGKGRTLMVTTPADGQWSNLPLTDLFLPLAQSMARYAAGGLSDLWIAQRNVTTGEGLVASFDQPLALRDVRIAGPFTDVAQTAGLNICSGESGSEVTLAAANWPGVYSILAPNHEAAMFAVRTPVAESDLTPLSTRQIAEFRSRLGFGLLDAERQPLALAQESLRQGRELWLPLIAMALALGILELAVTGMWAGGRS